MKPDDIDEMTGRLWSLSRQLEQFSAEYSATADVFTDRWSTGRGGALGDCARWLADILSEYSNPDVYDT